MLTGLSFLGGQFSPLTLDILTLGRVATSNNVLKGAMYSPQRQGEAHSVSKRILIYNHHAVVNIDLHHSFLSRGLHILCRTWAGVLGWCTSWVMARATFGDNFCSIIGFKTQKNKISHCFSEQSITLHFSATCFAFLELALWWNQLIFWPLSSSSWIFHLKC
jgi:hypothetical protein